MNGEASAFATFFIRTSRNPCSFRWPHVVFTVFLLAAFVIPLNASVQHTDADSCAMQMTSIGVVAGLWADEHQGKLPADFKSLSSILNTPQIFWCPADQARQAAATWDSFAAAHCSYEIVSPGLSKIETNTAFFRCTVHGFQGYADGTVFDGNERTKHTD